MIPNTQSWSGTGTIQLNDPDAQIQIDADGTDETVVFTSSVDIVGHGKMAGLLDGGESDVATFENLGGVYASGGELSMEQGLTLDDASVVPWTTLDASGSLVFEGTATALAGTFSVDNSGLIKFMAPVTTSGPMILLDGSLEIPGSHSFQYASFSAGGGGCTNPGSGSGPYTISGPSYSHTCP